MATKVTLLKSFNTGQGVAGGIDQYVNYPVDHDTNYTAIEGTINQLVDELASARTLDNLMILDSVLPLTITAGRFSVDAARLTTSVADITVSAGVFYAAGRRIETAGASFTSLANGTHYVATDQSGLLFVSTVLANQAFDIATVTVSGGVITAVVDHLSFDNLTTLSTAESQNRIYERQDALGVTQLSDDPTLRLQSVSGVDEDAGFYHSGTASRLRYASQRTSSEGIGTSVEAIELTERGQLQLFEQARVIATTTSENAGTSGALSAVNFDTAVRREPATYITNPWFTAPGTTFTQPTGDQYDGTYAFSGFVEFPATATGPFEADIQADGVTVAHGRIDKAASGLTVISLSGLGDLTSGATVQLRAATADAVAVVIDARIAFHLIGGRATV